MCDAQMHCIKVHLQISLSKNTHVMSKYVRWNVVFRSFYSGRRLHICTVCTVYIVHFHSERERESIAIRTVKQAFFFSVHFLLRKKKRQQTSHRAHALLCHCRAKRVIICVFAIKIETQKESVVYALRFSRQPVINYFIKFEFR